MVTELLVERENTKYVISKNILTFCMKESVGKAERSVQRKESFDVATKHSDFWEARLNRSSYMTGNATLCVLRNFKKKQALLLEISPKTTPEPTFCLLWFKQQTLRSIHFKRNQYCYLFVLDIFFSLSFRFTWMTPLKPNKDPFRPLFDFLLMKFNIFSYSSPSENMLLFSSYLFLCVNLDYMLFMCVYVFGEYYPLLLFFWY